MTGGEFTTSSVEGVYALNVTGRGGQASFAAVGLLRFDGRGNVSGSFTENRPGDRYGERTLIDVPYRATYSLGSSRVA